LSNKQVSHLLVIGMKRHDDLPEWEELCAVAMSVQNIHLVSQWGVYFAVFFSQIENNLDGISNRGLGRILEQPHLVINLSSIYQKSSDNFKTCEFSSGVNVYEIILTYIAL